MAMLVDPDRPLARLRPPPPRRRMASVNLSLQSDIIVLLAQGPKPAVKARAPRAKRLVWPLMERIETILKRHALSGAEMPNNPMLGRLLGLQHYSSAYRALKRMHAAGMLVLEIEAFRRRVIFPDGRSTGWGVTRPGHAPFCSRARGTPKPVVAIYRPPRPEYRPIPVEAAETCQWPSWGDDEKPNGRVCDAPTFSRRHSWCATHHALVIGKPAVVARVVSHRGLSNDDARWSQR